MALNTKHEFTDEEINTSASTTDKTSSNGMANSSDAVNLESPRRRNLIDLAGESAHKTLDLNRRLKGFEQSIKSLENLVNTSHQKFRHSILDLSTKSNSSKEELIRSQQNIQALENSFKSINAKAIDYSKQSASLTQVVDDLRSDQKQSGEFLDNKILETNNQLTLKIQNISSQVDVLETHFKHLDKQAEVLLLSSNNLSQTLQQQVSEQNSKIQSLQSDLNLKTRSLSNEIKHLEDKQQTSLDNINQVNDIKETQIRDDFEQKLEQTQQQLKQHKVQQQASLDNINQVNDIRQTQIRDDFEQKIDETQQQLKQHKDQQQSNLNDLVSQLTSEQAVLEQKSKELINQTSTQLSQQIQSSNNLLIQNVDTLTSHVNQHNDEIEVKLKALKDKSSTLEQDSIELKQELQTEIKSTKISIETSLRSEQKEVIAELKQDASKHQDETNQLKIDTALLSKDTSFLKENTTSLFVKTDVLDKEAKHSNEKITHLTNDFSRFNFSFNEKTEEINEKFLDVNEELLDINNKQTLQQDEIVKLQGSSEELIAHTDELQTKNDNLTIQALHADESIKRLQKQHTHSLADIIKVQSRVGQAEDETKNVLEQLNIAKAEEGSHFTLIRQSFLIFAIIFIATTIYLSKTNLMVEDKLEVAIATQSTSDTKNQEQQSTLNQKYNTHDVAILEGKQRQVKLHQEVVLLQQELSQYKQENEQLQQKLSKQVRNVSEDLKLVDDNVQYINQTSGPFENFKFGKLHGPKWFNQQNPNDVTIILGRYANKQAVYAFIENEGYFLRNKLAFFSGIENETIVYYLAYGQFNSETNAQITKNDLPYLLGDEQKEIIRFDVIQEIIKNVNVQVDTAAL